MPEIIRLEFQNQAFCFINHLKSVVDEAKSLNDHLNCLVNQAKSLVDQAKSLIDHAIWVISQFKMVADEVIRVVLESLLLD